jgi:transposase
MIQITFSEQDKVQFEYERYNHPHPRVQQKMWALHLKCLNKIPHELIAEITGVSPNTMRAYLKEYKTGGIDRLKQINFYRPKSKLIDYKTTIEEYFRANPPATVSEACAKIEELTGIKRGLTQTAKFIKSIGMKLRKVGSIPAKANNEIKKKSN